MGLQRGAVVRGRRWGGRYTGTVLRHEADSVFVAWHGSFVEDQLSLDEVKTYPDAPAELAGWCGAVGVLTSSGEIQVQPVRPR